MSFVINLLVSAFAIWIAVYISQSLGIRVDLGSGFIAPIIVALLLAIVNATIGALLRLITLPARILTLGLVTFIITVLMILLVDGLSASLSVGGFWAAAFFAIILTLVQMGLGTVGLKK